MIKITIKGIQDAKNYLGDVSRSIGYYATTGTKNAGDFLVNRIRARASSEYADSLEVVTDYAMMRTLIAPSPESIKDKETKAKSTYSWRFWKCPYWKWVAKKKLSGISFEPMLEVIVSESLKEIKEIIVRTIKEGIM